MSVGYVPEFFSKFKSQLFSTEQFDVPNKYRLPKNITLNEYQKRCLDKIEKKLSNDDSIAAFVMESGVPSCRIGVIIYPEKHQSRISKTL